MLLTLTFVVFFASIFVFFSQEFMRTFKKIFAVKGAELVLPLIIASWLIINFDYWVLGFLIYCREILLSIALFLMSLPPMQTMTSFLALIFLLTFISVFPVWLIDVILRKRNYKPYQYPYLTSTIIWFGCVALLTSAHIQSL